MRNFDIQITEGDGINTLQVGTFQNYDEAYIYLHKLMNNEEMLRKLEGLRLFIISEENNGKLMKGRSFADYFEFYDRHFDKIGKLQIDENSLDEPTEFPDPEDMIPEEMDEDEMEDVDNFIF